MGGVDRQYYKYITLWDTLSQKENDKNPGFP